MILWMRNFFQSVVGQRRIAEGTMILATTQILASLCGFLRDRAFSTMFPLDQDPLGVASIYITAFRPSDLLFQVFVMSCLSVVLVPFLASHLAHDRKEEVNHIVSSTMLVFGIIFGVLAIIMAIFFRDLAPYFVKFEGESLELYIKFGRIALCTNLLFVFGNTLGQYLITIQRYWIYGITPILWSIGTIAGTYFLTPFFGAFGPIFGTVIGTILYVALRFIAVIKSGYSFSLGKERKFLHGELKQMGILIFPRMAALGALQLQLLLLDRLASGLGPQMVAINQFASNFESVIPGIVGISIAQSAFSMLSQAAATKNHERLRKTFATSIFTNLIIAIPGALALYLLLPIAAWQLNLQASTSPLFTTALFIYCFAIPFESTNHIILRTFYALKNTLWPAISSIVSCFIAIKTGTMLLPEYGIFALAIAYVAAQVAQTLFLGSSLFFLLRSPSLEAKPVTS